MDWVNPLTKIRNKVKFQLFGRNYQNLLHLYAQIPKFDAEREGGMTEHSFNLFLNASGIFLTTQQIRTIRDSFPYKSGIAYQQFINDIRNDVTQKRLATIDHTFQQFNEGESASITNLLAHLAIQKHPHVRSLSKTAQRSRRDIEEGLKYFSGDGLHLSGEDFRSYFLDVNACVPLERQQFFVDLLIHAFGLNSSAVSLQRISQMEVTVFDRVRQRTGIKKDEGLRSSNAFKFLDLEEKGIVDFQRFVGVLDRIGCKFTERECKALFYKHSRGSNVLTYEEVCGLLFQMGSGNKDNTNPVFELAKTGQGYITTHGMTQKFQ